MAHYKNPLYRLSQYLCGIFTGFLMYTGNNQRSTINNKQIIVGWILSIGYLTTNYVYILIPSGLIAHNVYNSISRDLWAASICWIIYACHHLRSGGYFRSFLSQNFWQPLSKICLSVYLSHYLYLQLTYMNQKDIQWVDMWWQIHIHIADIFISFFIGTIFYLVIEAPTVQVVQLLFK